MKITFPVFPIVLVGSLFRTSYFDKIGSRFDSHKKKKYRCPSWPTPL